MEASQSPNPNVGLIPLVKRGSFVDPEWIRTEVDRQVQAERESYMAMQSAVSHLMVLDAAAMDEVTRDLATLQVKYDAKCMEYDAKCVDYDVKVDELKAALEALEVRAAVKLFDATQEAQLIELTEAMVQQTDEKLKLQREVEYVTKEKDACLKGLKHWQAETANVTQNLVAALSNRDALQLKLYTVSAELLEKERELTMLGESLKQKEHAETFALKVCGLAKMFAGAQQACDPAIDALGEDALPVTSADMEGGEDKKKKRKSKKKKSTA
jgi:chromosome segregation ATPase